MVAYDQLDRNIQIGAAVGLVAGLCIASILGGPPWTVAFGAWCARLPERFSDCCSGGKLPTSLLLTSHEAVAFVELALRTKPSLKAA